jgi:hypothetical protein
MASLGQLALAIEQDMIVVSSSFLT